MGKHLSVAEKHNAKNELIENRKKIKELRQQMNALKYRNQKLLYYLNKAKKSKHNGLFAEKGLCHEMFGKKASELTKEEKREYWKIKCREARAKKKEVKNENNNDCYTTTMG